MRSCKQLCSLVHVHATVTFSQREMGGYLCRTADAACCRVNDPVVTVMLPVTVLITGEEACRCPLRPLVPLCENSEVCMQCYGVVPAEMHACVSVWALAVRESVSSVLHLQPCMWLAFDTCVGPVKPSPVAVCSRRASGVTWGASVTCTASVPDARVRLCMDQWTRGWHSKDGSEQVQ